MVKFLLRTIHGHPLTGRIVTVDGARWHVASVHGWEPYLWAWLARVDNRHDQCRLSLRHEAFR